MYKKIVIFLSLFQCVLVTAESYKNFVILIASYNNEHYVEKNIISAIQDYPIDHYSIMYIDDCSTDTTYERAQEVIKRHALPNITLVRNEKRMGALYNHWYTINTYVKDDTIVVILDGDDQLAGNSVLKYLNELYTHHDIWLTYGQYREINSGAIGFNEQMPKDVVKNNAFRRHQSIPSHLRSFYAKLYKNIKLEDLQVNGEFFHMCADMATGIPMIEQARDHFMFIPKVLYLYNDTNPISDHRKSRELQMQIDRYVRSLPVYKPLKMLFH